MEDYLKHAIELVKAQASVRVMSEDEMADMIASLAEGEICDPTLAASILA